VVQFLEQVNLSEVAEIARNEGWDGRNLISLNQVRDKENFKNECEDLGVKKSALRGKLKVELENLFE